MNIDTAVVIVAVIAIIVAIVGSVDSSLTFGNSGSDSPTFTSICTPYEIINNGKTEEKTLLGTYRSNLRGVTTYANVTYTCYDDAGTEVCS